MHLPIQKKVGNSVILSFIVLCSAVFAVGQKAGPADEAVKDLVRRMTDAQIAYDQKALDSLYTPDFVEISPLGEFDERSKVLGFYDPKLRPEGMTSVIERSEYSVRHYGDIAVVIVRLEFEITIAGAKQAPRAMRATIVCRKVKGEWKAASAQYTGIRLPAVKPAQ